MSQRSPVCFVFTNIRYHNLRRSILVRIFIAKNKENCVYKQSHHRYSHYENKQATFLWTDGSTTSSYSNWISGQPTTQDNQVIMFTILVVGLIIILVDLIVLVTSIFMFTIIVVHLIIITLTSTVHQDCVVMRSNSGSLGQWAHVGCSKTDINFVCERKPTC